MKPSLILQRLIKSSCFFATVITIIPIDTSSSRSFSLIFETLAVVQQCSKATLSTRRPAASKWAVPLYNESISASSCVSTELLLRLALDYLQKVLHLVNLTSIALILRSLSCVELKLLMITYAPRSQRRHTPAAISALALIGKRSVPLHSIGAIFFLSSVSLTTATTSHIHCRSQD